MGTGECRACGVEFERHGRAPYRYCEAHRVSPAERNRQKSRAYTARKRAARSPVQCAVCGTRFLAKRSDARTCSKECKRSEVNRHAREFEGRNRSRCASCGKETARRSKFCRSCGAKDAGLRRRGENNYAWKGGRAQSKGYVYLLVDPEHIKGHRYRAEHLVVWESANGLLPQGWVVHHINGIKDDNRLENLQALPRKRHGEVHEQTIQQLLARIAGLEAQLDKGKLWKS